MVFQAISPSLFAPFSDARGRRPVLLFTYILYTFASPGLALNKRSYAVLLVLRSLQSLGASAVLSISYGVVADICVHSERGRLIGPIIAVSNLGVCIGPVIGVWIELGSGGFQWIFWALVIFGALMTLSIGLVLPETARVLVSNGNVKVKGLHATWLSI